MEILGNGWFHLEGAAERDRQEPSGAKLKGNLDEGAMARSHFPFVLDEHMQTGR